MISKLKKILELFPNIISITLTQQDFDLCRAELMLSDVSCSCTELRYKSLLIKKG